jgi:GNAT superfamily N-acetyltransferase
VESARPATPDDLADLSRLWAHAVSELEGQRGGGPLAGTLTRDDLAGWLTAALADPDRRLYLGFVDGHAVGLGSLWADRDRPDPLGQLELVFVEPDFRKIGVAEAMVDLAMAQCQEWGMTGIDAPALPGNRNAKSFFEVHGFQARLLIMHRRLPVAGSD